MYELNETNIKQMAEVTIMEIWSCIDWDKVDSRRAYGIWDEFASKIKAAAMTTNKYERFVEKLARKMDVRSLRYASIKEIGEQDPELKQAILKHIREQTLQLVLQVRLNNEARKAQKKALEKEQEKEQNRQVSFTEKGVRVDE